MLTALQNLVGKKREISAHSLISLQSKTHRVIKSHLKSFLKPSRISLIEWSILGILASSEEGSRFSSIAKEIAAEASFVTELINKLRDRQLIEISQDTKDRRVKIIRIASRGKKVVENVEKIINSHIEGLFKEITPSEFNTYIRVLEKIALRGLGSKSEDHE